MQGEDLAIHHHVHRAIEEKIDSLSRSALRQRMVDMCAIVKSRKIANQPDAPDRPPADVLDLTVVHLGLGRNHHGAAGELAIVKSQKQAAPPVHSFFSIHAQRKWPALEASERNEDGRLVTEFTPARKTTGSQSSNVGGEPNTQQIDVVKNAIFVRQSDHIAGLGTARQQRFDSMLYAAIAKFPQKGVARAQGKKRQRWAALRPRERVR